MNKYQSNSKAKEKQAVLMRKKKRLIESNALHNMYYCTHNYSFAAGVAFKNQKKPFSGWTLKNIIDAIQCTLEEEGYTECEMKRVFDCCIARGLKRLRVSVLVPTAEKHHVGEHYSLVRFYKIDRDKLITFVERCLYERIQ